MRILHSASQTFTTQEVCVELHCKHYKLASLVIKVVRYSFLQIETKMNWRRAIQILIGGLPLLNPSDECSEAAPPILCFAMFGLCNNQSRELYLPSSQQCILVTEGICAEEFAAAGAIFGSNQLPHAVR